MGEPVLEIANLRKRYGDLAALDGVSLTVEQGEVFGLLGPNGAGKTTLLSIAAGLTRADEGTVALFGKPFTRDSRDLRHLVGIGTQDLAIYPDLTARENLNFFGKLYGLRGSHLKSRVGAVLDAVGLTDRANDRAGTFSGGMKRRLNLAVAVVHEPKLLFLDEPTTGVDPQSRNHIFEQVQALNRGGLTVIYTSHYMEEVQTLCNRIAILDAGHMRASDTLPNLLKRLDATIRIEMEGAPPEFATVLKALPGVKRVDGLLPSPLAGEGGESSSRVRGELINSEELRGTAKASAPSPGGEAPPPSPAPRPAGSSADRAAEEEGEGKTGSTFTLTADDIGPVLARVASACAARGAALVSATTSEPTLERVFLHLTGRGLRD